MIRLDSLDLEIDTGPLPDFNPRGMRRTVSTDPETSEERTAHTAGGRELSGFHGIGGIRVTPEGVGLRVSSKVLGENAPDGIHAGNLPDVCEAFARTGFIGLSPDHLLGAVVRRGDPFLDVLTEGDGPTSDALRLVAATGGPGLRSEGRGESVTLYAQLPHALAELRAYPKLPDLLKAKNRAFREAHPSVLEAARDRLRVELQVQSRRGLRHVAGLTSASGCATLADVLNAPGTPLADALDGVLTRWDARARSPSPLPSMPHTLDHFLATPSGSFQDDAFRTQAALVVDLAEGDLAAAEAILRARYGAKNWYRYRRHVLAAVEARAEMMTARRRSPERPQADEDRPPAARPLRLVASRLRALEAA